MSRYLKITEMVIRESLYYRIHFISTFIGNLLLILVTYYLWGAIFEYSSRTEIGGLTCTQTIFYITCASAINSMLTTAIDSEIARHFTTGDISVMLASPLNYFRRIVFHNLGLIAPNFILIFIPSIIVIVAVLRYTVSLSNITLFLFAMLGSCMINFLLDFSIGMTAFYTGNIWTIRIIKNSISTIFSGVVVPITFFNNGMKLIAYLLPFQAIYNTPSCMIAKDRMQIRDIVFLFGVQVIWIVIFVLIANCIYRHILQNIEVNGG